MNVTTTLRVSATKLLVYCVRNSLTYLTAESRRSQRSRAATEKIDHKGTKTPRPFFWIVAAVRFANSRQRSRRKALVSSCLCGQSFRLRLCRAASSVSPWFFLSHLSNQTAQHTVGPFSKKRRLPLLCRAPTEVGCFDF